MSPYRREEDVVPPEPQRMSDVAIMRFEHIRRRIRRGAAG